MSQVPVPKTGFVEQLTKVPRAGVSRWRNADGDRLYEWDGLHGEWEVYNARGKHLGAVHAATGVGTKEAVRGRTIDV